MKKISLTKPKPAKARLLLLPPDQREKLIGWMTSGATYREIKDRVEKEFSVAFKSLTPFGLFWKTVCHPIMKQRQTGLPCLPASTSDAFRKSVEKVLADPHIEIEELKRLLRLVIRGQQVELAREKLSLNKASKESRAKSEAIEEVNPLDDDEKLRQVRIEVFGSAPE